MLPGIYKSFISILLILFSWWGHAQKKDFIPTGLRLGTDLSQIGVSLFDDRRSNYEFHADLDFYRYFISFDYGSAEITRTEQTFTYFNSGTYYRIGPDINFLFHDKSLNVFFFGFRFARSNFDHRLSFVYQDSILGSVPVTRENYSVDANWLEMVTGIKVRIWNNLFLGYTARLKFSKSTGASDQLLPFDIPGFGGAKERSQWGLNYHVLYLINFRKKVVPEKERG